MTTEQTGDAKDSAMNCQSKIGPRRIVSARLRRRRSGFTLVELMVVIAIIAVLAGLITAATISALWSAKQFRIKSEVDNLAAAMEAFKAKYGAYPPSNMNIQNDPAALQALKTFMSRAFPRYDVSNLVNDLKPSAANVETGLFEPQESLAFWLSGLGPDPTDPFNRARKQITVTPFFEFDKSRLIDETTGATYVPVPGNVPRGELVYNAPYGKRPYAYIDYRSYGTITPGTPPTITVTSNITTLPTGSTDMIAPYIVDQNGNGVFENGETFAKPDSFQIISAGQDGDFGSSPVTTTQRLYPTGIGYDPATPVGTLADDDNVTNFCEKSSLGAAKP